MLYATLPRMGADEMSDDIVKRLREWNRQYEGKMPNDMIAAADLIESLRQQLADQREAFAVIAETPVSGEQDDITMEAKDRIAKAIRAWEPKP